LGLRALSNVGETAPSPVCCHSRDMCEFVSGQKNSICSRTMSLWLFTQVM